MNIPGTDQAWPVLLRLIGGHTKIYQATNGRIGHRFPGAPPILLLDHTGAKSGTRRTSPLAYATDGSDLVIVASKGGNPRNPAWFHNLKAHPDTSVQVGSEQRDVHARIVLDGPEHENLWAKAVAVYKGYDDYQARAERKIPLVVLEPR